MRVLFLHRNFPGPFRHIARHFGEMEGSTVLFLSERGSKELRLPGVRRLRIAPSSAPEARDEVEREVLLSLRQGAKTANALLRLRQDGFTPDIVYGSASEGHSFYVRDIFPDAFLVMRADWFNTRGESHNFFHGGKPRPSSDFALPRARNLTQYNALGDCDLAVTSSQWQKEQYPELLARKIRVLHDGVDAAFFSPSPGVRFIDQDCDLSGVPELVTFSCRYAGPARGFPQFCRALPPLMAERPRCHALIMVARQEDERREPRRGDAGRNGLEDLRDVLAAHPGLAKRVHVLEFRSALEYRMLLRASTAHVYFTSPSALSAGLFEALSCGALVVGSDTAPIREVLRHGQNGFLADFWDAESLAKTLAGVLERAPRFMSIREAARETVLRSYEQNIQTMRHAQLILEEMARR